jgi:hypothetical protein
MERPMTARSRKTVAVRRGATPGAKTKKHLDDLLDRALEQTFPASDTPALIEPGDGAAAGTPAGPDDTPTGKRD